MFHDSQGERFHESEHGSWPKTQNPKPRVQQFGTSILQVGAMQWHQMLAFDNIPCEAPLLTNCNLKIIF